MSERPTPVAWMRADGENGEVSTMVVCISARVKNLWLKINPKRVERYTLPLYCDESLIDPSQDDPECPGGVCSVCGMGVRYGERHSRCGTTVMRLERQRDELADALRSALNDLKQVSAIDENGALRSAKAVISYALARIDAEKT